MVATWIVPKWKRQTQNNNTETRHSDWLNSPSLKFYMSDNKKQEKDYTKEVEILLPEASSIANVCLFRALNLFN